MKMKILIVCSGLDVPGGYEKMTCSLANALAGTGHQVSLLVVAASAKSFYPIHYSIQRSFIPLSFGIGNPGNKISRKVAFVKDVRTLCRAIKNLDPDITLTTEYPLSVAVSFGRFPKNHHWICWHHNAFDNRKSFFWDLATRRAYRRADQIVALNPDEQAKYQRFNKNTTVIPNFVAHNTIQARLDTKRILTIARAKPVKGIDLLLQAAHLIAKRYPDWEWKLISDARPENIHPAGTQGTAVPANLLTAFPQSANLEQEYLAASIYVLPSRRELFPMVLLEAQSYGVPSVAFDCPSGPKHIINDRKDGILVERENPEQLAAAIGLLIEDAQRRTAMGSAAFANAERFSKEHVLQQWNELLVQLTPGR
jgi:glycosyltransferase involved in cell wall biosynthesis